MSWIKPRSNCTGSLMLFLYSPLFQGKHWGKSSMFSFRKSSDVVYYWSNILCYIFDLVRGKALDARREALEAYVWSLVTHQCFNNSNLVDTVCSFLEVVRYFTARSVHMRFNLYHVVQIRYQSTFMSIPLFLGLRIYWDSKLFARRGG